MTFISLTGLYGEPLWIGVPDEQAVVIRESTKPNHPPATLVTFGSVFAKVRETPREVIDAINDGRDTLTIMAKGD